MPAGLQDAPPFGLRFRGIGARNGRSARMAVADVGAIPPRLPFVSCRGTLEQRTQLQQAFGSKSSAATRAAGSALQTAVTCSIGLVEQKRRPGREEGATMTGGSFETEAEVETETDEAAISRLEASSTALLYGIGQPHNRGSCELDVKKKQSLIIKQKRRTHKFS